MCAKWMCGVAVGFSYSVPSLANVSAFSFPTIPMWARTLCMWIRCGIQ